MNAATVESLRMRISGQVHGRFLRSIGLSAGGLGLLASLFTRFFKIMDGLQDVFSLLPMMGEFGISNLGAVGRYIRELSYQASTAAINAPAPSNHALAASPK